MLVRPVRPDESLGSPVEGLLVFGSGNVLTFTPHLPLDVDTTYQVDFLSDPVADLGLRDVAGNLIAPHTFRFSTGASGPANPAPVIAAFHPEESRIAPGATVDFLLDASDDGGPLSYRLNPGDGSGFGPWQTSADFLWTYADPGRYTASVQVRDELGNLSTATARLLVLTPPTGPAPTQSRSILVATDGTVWTVNPDAHSVTVLDGSTGAKLAEHGVGRDPRSLAEDAQGRIWIACHDDDRIDVLTPHPDDPAVVVRDHIDLDYGSAQ